MIIHPWYILHRAADHAYYYKPVLWIDGGLLITPEGRAIDPVVAEYRAFRYASRHLRKPGHRFHGASILRGSAYDDKRGERPPVDSALPVL